MRRTAPIRSTRRIGPAGVIARVFGCVIAGCCVAGWLSLAALPADAGGLIRAPAVGGVYVDAEGVVSVPPQDGAEQLRATWQAGLEPLPADLEPLTDRRFVSLRRLSERVAAAEAAGEALPDAVRYLAGLLRVQYVLVYPPADGQPGDVVLAGPAEGWVVDTLGNTVGATTRRPVLMLDDLVVALRAVEATNGPGVSCSIDPTPEGLARAQKVDRQLKASDGPLTAARRLEQAIGRQVIRVTGVPETSHFARSLVAADFRMKRLAMGFDPAPVDGLPSYLQMVDAANIRANLLPRWWLAADYEPLRTDADRLAWEIRGQGVKCLAEEDLVSASGELERGVGKADSTAARWAEKLSERFNELADHDSAFGHVRNAFDLSVVAALLSLEDLWTVAGMTGEGVLADHQPEVYGAPREVATQATFRKKGRRWVITASGGVQLFPWQIADRSEADAKLGELRIGVEPAAHDNWWWQ